MVSLAALLLLPALPPATLRLEYRLDDAGLLAIAWSASRAADLLLSGIEPLGAVKRLIVAMPRGALLRRIPFEALGGPPMIERFTVWYEPVTGQSSSAAPLARLWALPSDVSAPFLGCYEEKLGSGLEPVEALRPVKNGMAGLGGRASPPFLLGRLHNPKRFDYALARTHRLLLVLGGGVYFVAGWRGIGAVVAARTVRAALTGLAPAVISKNPQPPRRPVRT